MNEQINSWLNSGRDYATGVALYEQFGSSASQKRLLRMGGPTKRNIDSLHYELSKLVRYSAPMRNMVPAPRPAEVKPTVAPVAMPTKPAPAPRVKELTANERRDNTPQVDELTSHVIGLMKVRDQLHATLEHVSKAQRAKDARLILEISDEITECYERLEHYNKTGILREKEKKVERKKVREMDIPELMKLQQNLRTYVSKYKKYMEGAKSPQKKEQHRRRMETFQLELTDVENRLKK